MNGNMLKELHEAVCAELLRRVCSGSAASGDIANAIRFLKDNGMLRGEHEAGGSFPDFPGLMPEDGEIEALFGEDYP